MENSTEVPNGTLKKLLNSVVSDEEAKERREQNWMGGSDKKRFVVCEQWRGVGGRRAGQ
jgi:hypothetical protein